MPTLIASVGLPRSGKSTVLRQLSLKLHAPIVNRDCIRLALHGSAYASEAEDFTRAIYKTMIRALFLAGHEVVLADETHYSRAARRHIEDGPWRTRYIVVETSPGLCIERAIMTDQAYLWPVITEMAGRYEPLGKLDSHYDTCVCKACTTWICEACGYRGPAGICNCPTEDE